MRDQRVMRARVRDRRGGVGGVGLGGLALLATGGLLAMLVFFLRRGGDMTLIALAVVGAVGAVFAMQVPLAGLVAMAALTVGNASENLIASFGAPSVAKLAGPGLALILAARWALFRERPFFDAKAMALFVGYGALTGVSCAYAMVWSSAVEATIEFGKDTIIILLTLAFFHKPDALTVYVRASIAILTVICILCIYQVATGDFSNDFAGFARFLYDSRRLSGPINDPNFFASSLVFFVPLLMRDSLYGKTLRMKALGVVLLLIFMVAIVLTASRGALISVAACIGLFMLLLDAKRLTLVSVVGAVIGVAVVAVLSESLIERFELIFSPLDAGVVSDPAIEGRLASWRVATELFFQNPLLGVGAGNYNHHFQSMALDLGLIFRGEGRSAHSLYLEIAAELGLVGLLGFATIVFAAMVGCLRAMARAERAGMPGLRLDYAAFGIGLFGYLVSMIFLHDSYPRLLYTTLAIAIAMPKIADLRIAEERARGADDAQSVT